MVLVLLQIYCLVWQWGFSGDIRGYWGS